MNPSGFSGYEAWPNGLRWRLKVVSPPTVRDAWSEERAITEPYAGTVPHRAPHRQGRDPAACDGLKPILSRRTRSMRSRRTRKRTTAGAFWSATALIWLVAFWAPVIGAYATLAATPPGQPFDRLAANAALVYTSALALGIAAVTRRGGL